MFVRDGYIRVFQDIRGKYGSEGDYVVIREAKKISKGSARLKAIHDARKKLAAGTEDKKKAKAADKAAAAAKK